MKQLLGIALAVPFGLGLQPPASGSVLMLDAPKLFEQSVAQHLRLSEDQAGVELEAGELFEDDGPASGHSYQKPANQEVVTPDTWIKKELIITDRSHNLRGCSEPLNLTDAHNRLRM